MAAAAISRDNLRLLLASKHEIRALAAVERLLAPAGPQPSGGSSGGGAPPLGPVVGGLFVRLKFGSYEFAQVLHVAEIGNTPVLAVQVPVDQDNADGVAVQVRLKVPLTTVSGTDSLADAHWEALGQAELGRLAAYLQRHGRTLPLAEAAAAAWRKQAALQWHREHGAQSAAEQQQHLPALRQQLQDAAAIAEVQRRLTVAEARPRLQQVAYTIALPEHPAAQAAAAPPPPAAAAVVAPPLPPPAAEAQPPLPREAAPPPAQLPRDAAAPAAQQRRFTHSGSNHVELALPAERAQQRQVAVPAGGGLQIRVAGRGGDAGPPGGGGAAAANQREQQQQSGESELPPHLRNGTQHGGVDRLVVAEPVRPHPSDCFAPTVAPYCDLGPLPRIDSLPDALAGLCAAARRAVPDSRTAAAQRALLEGLLHAGLKPHGRFSFRQYSATYDEAVDIMTQADRKDAGVKAAYNSYPDKRLHHLLAELAASGLLSVAAVGGEPTELLLHTDKLAELHSRGGSGLGGGRDEREEHPPSRRERREPGQQQQVQQVQQQQTQAPQQPRRLAPALVNRATNAWELTMAEVMVTGVPPGTEAERLASLEECCAGVGLPVVAAKMGRSGLAYLTFGDAQQAAAAFDRLQGHEIAPGWRLLFKTLPKEVDLLAQRYPDAAAAAERELAAIAPGQRLPTSTQLQQQQPFGRSRGRSRSRSRSRSRRRRGEGSRERGASSPKRQHRLAAAAEEAPPLAPYYFRTLRGNVAEWRLIGCEVALSGLPKSWGSDPARARKLVESTGAEVVRLRVIEGDERGDMAIVRCATAAQAASVVAQLFGRKIDGSLLFLRCEDKEVDALMRHPRVAAAAEQALADARAGRWRSSSLEGSRERGAQRGSGRKRSRIRGRAAEGGRENSSKRRGRSRDRTPPRSRTPSDATARLPRDAPLVPVCVRHLSGRVGWSLCSSDIFVSGLEPLDKQTVLGALTELLQEAGATVVSGRVRAGDARGDIANLTVATAAQAAHAIEQLQHRQVFGRCIFLSPMRDDVQRLERAHPGAATAAQRALADRAAREQGVQPAGRSGSRQSNDGRGGRADSGGGRREERRSSSSRSRSPLRKQQRRSSSGSGRFGTPERSPAPEDEAEQPARSASRTPQRSPPPA